MNVIFCTLFITLLAMWHCSQAFLPPARVLNSVRSIRQSPLYAESGKSADTKGNKEEQMSKFLKYECVSCSYIYDEEKGFKKRYPPGTRFSTLEVFMCPVCGAAIDQFKPVEE
mmetsp:Transcript_30480/g.51492  ORF Transcript_30480/g.51492 Transcript_30480/m.51492 type:complete len:113 (-) Transcript_30480:215-553(-)